MRNVVVVEATRGLSDYFAPSILSNILMDFTFVRVSFRDSPELGPKEPIKRSSMHLRAVVLEAIVAVGIIIVGIAIILEKEIPEGGEDAGGAVEAAEVVAATMTTTMEVVAEEDMAETTTITETTKITGEEVKITDQTTKKLLLRMLSFSSSLASVALQLNRL